MSKFFDYVIHHPSKVKKFFVAVIGLAISAVVLGVDGYTTTEIVTLLTEVLAAMGVYSVSNNGQEHP